MPLSVARLAIGAIAASVLSLSAPSRSHAQATGTIRGHVVDGSTRRPVIDAQVIVTGTRLGAVTDNAGAYTVTTVPAGSQSIRARRIGYSVNDQTTNVEAGAEARVDFTLRPSPTQLNTIVVTGTAGAAEKRTVGNAVTQLDVADLTDKSTVLNVTDILQSKTPGVTIMPGSGVPGAAADIRIRGASSLSGYKPVIYIDGIRYNTEGLGNFNPTGSGLAGQGQSAQATSALNLISPEDIESLEVIKGPAAATLYGADAANGVIQIITKKGTRGQQALRWTAKAEAGRTEWALDPPTNYTVCDAVKRAMLDAQGKPVWPGCQGVPLDTLLTDNPLRRDPNALRTGNLQRLSLSLRGGGDRYSFYLSGDHDGDEGVYFNSYNKQTSARELQRYPDRPGRFCGKRRLLADVASATVPG